MLNFLLTKNLRTGKLERDETFGDEARPEALARFEALERDELDTEHRTVLLRAPDRATAFRTHRPCFGE
jgi:hypothetical protein